MSDVLGNGSPGRRSFSKYDEMGAYHWSQMDRRSPLYNPPLEARYRILLRRLGRVGRVLDVGCGDGYLLGRAAFQCGIALGLEAEVTGIRLAAERLQERPNCRVVRGSCYAMPVQSGWADAVLLSDVVEHLEEPDVCLKEIARVLALDGRLIVTTPRWRPDRMWDPNHVKEFRPEELREFLERRFREVALSYFWPMWWSRMYATRYGWHLIKKFARFLYNPFSREGRAPDRFGQILAECRGPLT